MTQIVVDSILVVHQVNYLVDSEYNFWHARRLPLKFIILEDTSRYAGLLLANAEGFNLRTRFLSRLLGRAINFLLCRTSVLQYFRNCIRLQVFVSLELPVLDFFN